MDQESYKEYYEVESNKYSPGEGEHYYREEHHYRHDRFFNVRHFASQGDSTGKIILDVGCGNGYQMAPLAKNNSVYGLDISENNIEKAISLGIRAQCHDVEERFPYEDNFFDVVVCSELLEHLFFPEQVIKECYRILKDSGTFIITVPNLYCLQNRLSMLMGRGSRYIEYPQNMNHVRFYSLKGMSNILSEIGFKVNHVRGQEFAMNYYWPFKLIWYLHGGNRGLKLLIRIVTLGKKTEIPGLVLQHHIIRFFGRVFPRLSWGLVFVCQKTK